MNKARDMNERYNQELFKLNLHSHTRYSDGANTIREMALTSKNLGFCCHVITDHYYGSKDLSFCSMTRESYLEARREAKEVSRKLDFPIIVGAECGYNRAEEINVFGKDAILYLMDHGVTHDDYLKVRDKYWCAMILNHPSLGKSMTSKVWEVIDGFERFNSGQDYFSGEAGEKERRLIPIELSGVKQFCNSDAHQESSIERGYNIICTKITSETSLINYLKSELKPLRWCANGRIKTYMESINKAIQELEK